MKNKTNLNPRFLQMLILTLLFSLHWSCGLIEGDPGEPGTQGPPGPQGEIGIPGERGGDGLPGETGPRGPQCERGDQGAAGAQGPTGLQGERGPQGERGLQGPQGAPGNANVRMFKFTQGHNFATTRTKFVTIPGLTAAQANNSVFLWYLVSSTPSVYSIPGYGSANSFYKVFMRANNSFSITTNGTGENYVEIRVFVIESSQVSNVPSSIVPPINIDTILLTDITTSRSRIQNPDLDISNYHEVAEYYGY